MQRSVTRTNTIEGPAREAWKEVLKFVGIRGSSNNASSIPGMLQVISMRDDDAFCTGAAISCNPTGRAPVMPGRIEELDEEGMKLVFSVRHPESGSNLRTYGFELIPKRDTTLLLATVTSPAGLFRPMRLLFGPQILANCLQAAMPGTPS